MVMSGLGGASSMSLMPGGVVPDSIIWRISINFPGCGGSVKSFVFASAKGLLGRVCGCRAEKKFTSPELLTS